MKVERGFRKSSPEEATLRAWVDGLAKLSGSEIDGEIAESFDG